jgi:putative aldouronate transport system permease protein
MIVMRTYFSTQIPDELHEASVLDGCKDIRFLVQIVIPLSKPIIAVITLYYAVSMWNEYFYPMIYLTSREKLPLPNILREILMVNAQHALSNTNLSTEDMEAMSRLEQRAELMKYSLIVVASVPVMILYPFIQKYFVRGIMIGAVKG